MIEFSSQVFGVDVYGDYSNKKKTSEVTDASASVGLLLATALLVWDVYVVDSLKRYAREKRSSGQCRKVVPPTRIPSHWRVRVDQNMDELFKLLANKVTTITM